MHYRTFAHVDIFERSVNKVGHNSLYSLSQKWIVYLWKVQKWRHAWMCDITQHILVLYKLIAALEAPLNVEMSINMFVWLVNNGFLLMIYIQYPIVSSIQVQIINTIKPQVSMYSKMSMKMPYFCILLTYVFILDLVSKPTLSNIEHSFKLLLLMANLHLFIEPNSMYSRKCGKQLSLLFCLFWIMFWGLVNHFNF
jgi:hypothetical protein